MVKVVVCGAAGLAPPPLVCDDDLIVFVRVSQAASASRSRSCLR
jgi:hypothetical protein